MNEVFLSVDPEFWGGMIKCIDNQPALRLETVVLGELKTAGLEPALRSLRIRLDNVTGRLKKASAKPNKEGWQKDVA